ncbi:MAG TPA: C25 family cysteine peptidase [Candidatus Cloacimonadota bacterium]|nr:C25 family cysteine peptidase [Candidatus Cloacimonadota bacterium]HOR58126.1 C25 family cysteine peptidase [Candidatus Cloacimonadota bacterium]HPB08154.1 C25 family cysteine peptidase [Candidatus Cloacimonadota bacterium]HPL22815.1 C25 family cysteine peptidase [Candidatus Cloacimonadota bacterium]HQO44802.1 C25 family cysteine peptidase [Candidatus Cloacimonadota bacterium]
MKRTIVSALLSLSLCLAFALITESQPVQHREAFEITARSRNYMDIRFTLPEFEMEDVTAGGQSFQKIMLPGAGTTMTSGLPELPVLTLNLAIPRQGSVNLQVLSSRTTSLQQFNAYPVQQGAELESPKAFQQDAGFYAAGASYPQTALEYGDPVILRDFRIMTININPFSYDPASQQLNIRNSLDFRVNFSPTPGINELVGELTHISPAFARIYESVIFNFDDYRNLIDHNVPPRYLIIHGNNTDPNFIASLNEYVLWKRQKGADVDVANTSSASAGSSTTSIKTYIQNRYNNPATRPDFVILIGDTVGSYAIPCYNYSGGAGDYPYTHLAGNDLLGDVFIGRISAENLAQLQVLFAKIYLYEKDINVELAGWLDRMLLVGCYSQSGISTIYINKYIKEISLVTNPNYTYTELYTGSPATTQINTAINRGVGFYSFRGWINYTPPAESALSNAYRLLHAVNITCSSNNYDGSGASEIEQFIRYGTPAAPKGAVTGIGMSTSSTHTAFNNVLHGGIFGGIFAHGMRTMGEALLSGKLFMHQVYGVSTPTNVEKFTHWCNLMGDPTMEVFTGRPNFFNVATLDSIPQGLNLMDFAVADSMNIPVEGACVTISQGSSIISRGFTDGNGNVIMTLPQSMVAGECVITVSKHNFKPYQQNINVVNHGTLVPGEIVVDDSNVPPSSGNGDGNVNAGETVEIQFGLFNTGSAAISGISGYVCTNNPYVTLVDSLVTYATIADSSQGFNTSPVVLQVAHNAPHESMVRIHLILTDSQGNSYDVSEFIPIHNAKIMYNNSFVTNGGNQVLDPGETAGFAVTVSNTTPTTVTNITGRLYSRNDLVSVGDNTAYYGELPLNVQVTPSTDFFEITGRPALLPGMVIPMQLKLYNEAGFEQWLDFSITIGEVSVTDPLGPDSYGYVIYDDQDLSYEACPVYEWIGIAPAEGGFGTALAISDAYTSDEEGDQVSADALEVVNLPFPFQFYGLLYDQITVCSNGFIALGVTENAEFRNYRLPGPMGPNPMIAAFWDDLATHSGGGIYTWFDRTNHAFVIEWYNLRNGKNGTSPETFQVILYDQSAHPTSMGDGPIKIQYHTFNNINSQSGNRHGCYCTIGIENHTGDVGLEYSFNNTYPVAASPLGNQRAIYITNVPIYHEAAHVILGDTFITDGNGNSVCEPGETIELGVQLKNIGNMTAEGIEATLSTENQYVTMIDSVSTYFPLESECFGVNRDPFRFAIAPNCPNGEVVEFNLEVVSGESLWSRPFSIRVDASVLVFESYMINDVDGTYNGIIDPLETVQLVINVKNQADVESRDILASLSSSNSEVSIGHPLLQQPLIGANAIQQFVYELQFTGTSGLGSYIPFQFNASLGNGLPISANILLPYNIPNVFHDFEADNGNMISEAGWVWGTPSQVTPYSGSKVWATGLSGTYPEYANYNLITPIYRLSENSVLTFKHRYGLEANYDGGNVSISTNDGESWQLITPQGGYPYYSINSLGGESGFSGSIANWETVSFNLSQFSGQQVRLRFRMASDASVSGIGWFIDDFELSGVNQVTGYLHGNVIATSDTPVTEVVVKASNNMCANPDANGYYRLYLPNGSYSATASLLHHQSSTTNSVQISTSAPVYLADFTLINLPKPEGAGFDVDNDTGAVTLSWNQPLDPVLPVMGYKVYKKFNSGPFEMIQQTTDTIYNDHLTLTGNYKYLVTAIYFNVEGCPSDTLSFAYPYVSEDDPVSPALVTKLHGNYPNPFNPSTTISFDLAKNTKVKLSVYNLRGQLVKTLASGELAAGRHQLIWNGTDSRNRSVASGVYLFRLDAGNYRSTRKMMLIK